MVKRRSKIRGYQQRKLLELYVGGVPARTAAELAGVNRNTATLYYQKLRQIIALEMLEDSPFDGEVEIDESYFGGKRKGKRGRGAAGKVPVFGILKRNGRVYAKVITDVSCATLMPLIKQKIAVDSVVYSDTWKAYNTLDIEGFRHRRINHSEVYVDPTDNKNHINGIENFWSHAKRNLRKYNGIPKKSFELFLKECEFRFNSGSPAEQLFLLRKWCKKHSI
jgi:transposase